ncbi:MAG: EamA family transporter [Spirochaetaceae bacterium]|nr:EamA family transporter [Spirochaetaceae bacterium]
MSNSLSPAEASAEGLKAPITAAASGYLVAVVATIFLSLTGILISLVSRRHGVPALVIAVWRDVFASATLAVFLALRAPRLLAISGKDLAFLAMNGAVLAVFNILWTLSVVRNGAAAATLLVYSSGGFTVLLGRLFFRERAGWAKAAAVLASLAGAALVSGIFAQGASAAEPLGVAAGLASGLAYAAYSLVGKGGANRGISPWTNVCYSFGIAALFLLAARLLPAGILPAAAVGPGGLFLPGRPAEAWWLLVLLAAGPTALGFGLYNASLALLPAGTVNLVASSEPIFAAAMAYAFLGERLGPGALAGGALILLAVLLLRFAKEERQNESA